MVVKGGKTWWVRIVKLDVRRLQDCHSWRQSVMQLRRVALRQSKTVQRQSLPTHHPLCHHHYELQQKCLWLQAELQPHCHHGHYRQHHCLMTLMGQLQLMTAYSPWCLQKGGALLTLHHTPTPPTRAVCGTPSKPSNLPLSTSHMP